MHAAYIARRFGVFLLILWLAATLNFFLPRLSGQDPVHAKLLQQAALGGYVHAGIEEMTQEYERRFGLDQPLWQQYLTYLRDVARLDFNYSIANYPKTVRELVADAVPWTLGLLGTTTLLSFVIGSLLGALLAWPRAPRWMLWLMPPLWALHAIPFFLLGLILTYLLAFQIPLLPIGGWALGMRGMMVTTMGEDYVVFAEAKGLRAPTVFLHYCLRNAILPQVTALALTLGQILSGAVLVEVIFGYPGIGTLLFQAIRENDHFVSPDVMRGAAGGIWRYLRRNPSLTLGVALLAALGLFVVIGGLVVDIEDARPLSVPTLRPPSRAYPFGTDRQGRDLLEIMIAGTPLTLRIGFIAGFLGVGLGTVLAFAAAYYRGLLDVVIRGIADIGLTVPGLLVLIIISVSIKGTLTVNQMAMVVASLAWLYPTRTIRAQVLSLRERGYVEVARLSGMSGPGIIFLELMPNLLPYLAATLVNSVSAAILASIGLEVLGLGPIDAPTLGMTLYWVNFNAAMINGWWWWWLAPTVVIVTVFLGLFFLTVGLDEIANPRLRRSA